VAIPSPHAPGRLDLRQDEQPHGVLYVVVTAEIVARVYQHRNGTGSGFCRRYNCTVLALAEEHPTIQDASRARRRSRRGAATGRYA
jgi:predicted GIY-YIG superfamily endonuclease